MTFADLMLWKTEDLVPFKINVGFGFTSAKY